MSILQNEIGATVLYLTYAPSVQRPFSFHILQPGGYHFRIEMGAKDASINRETEEGEDKIWKTIKKYFY